MNFHSPSLATVLSGAWRSDVRALLALPILFLILSSPTEAKTKRIHTDANGNAVHDPRPARWCGWFMRQRHKVADRAANQAIWWKHYGSPASGPAPGVIAVWLHHVGEVIGVPGPGKIVLLSGNDGHAVRERERSSRGVIAWRWPNSFGITTNERTSARHARLETVTREGL